MAPTNRVSTKRGPQEDVVRALDYAGEEQSDDSDSESGAVEEGPTPLVPPKKPKFLSPLKQPRPEPAENGSACSSPSASGFVIVPSQKPMKMNKGSASKLFSDDDVISILKWLSLFWVNGKNSKWAEFHLFVKDDLGNKFSKTQLSEKIRLLKKKFENNSERARANGGRIDLSDPHESAVFELSRALWGDDKEKDIAPEKGQKEEEEEAKEIIAEKEDVVENDEGSKKKKKKKKKKRKQVSEGEENKEMRKQEHVIEESVGEGDVHDAANTILSIRKLVDENGEGNMKLELVDEHGEGNKKMELVDEDGEGNKKSKLVNKKSKLVDKNCEGNKKSKLVDENGEENKKSKLVDEDGEGNKKSKLVDENGEGNKKSRKKKRKQGNELDEKKELVNEGMGVDGHDEENKVSSKQKQINGGGERNKKMKKTKRVVECDEANKIAGEEKEVDEHAGKGEISKEVDQHNDEEENLLKERKQVDEHEQQDKKISKKQKQEMETRVDDFQSVYPMLHASFNTSEYPKVVMRTCVLIGRENAQELEDKWRELKAQELRLELKRLDLMKGRGK